MSQAGRSRQLPFSLALLALFGVLGWSVLPSRATTGATTGATMRASVWRLQDPAAANTAAGLDGRIGTPVFALRPDGIAVLFGDAAQSPDGVIRVGLFDPLDPLLANATMAVSLPSDVRLLWLLASEDERRRLRDMAGALAAGISESAVTILQSPEFAAEYRPRLLEIIQAALMAAWRDARTQEAWVRLVQASEPILRDVAAHELRPIVTGRFEGVASRLLRDNLTRLIPVFGAGDWDLDAVEQAVRAIVADVRDRDIPEHTARRLLAPWEARHFLQVFAGVVGDGLVQNPALIDLAARLATDTRFRQALAATAGPAAILARTAPRLMVSLHGSTDLNLVASFVIHTMVAGRTDRVVVLMSKAQYQEIAAIDPGAAHVLRLAGS